MSNPIPQPNTNSATPIPVVGALVDGLLRRLRSSLSSLPHLTLFTLAVLTVSAASLIVCVALVPILVVAAAVLVPTLPVLAVLAYICCALVYLMSAQDGRPAGTRVLLRWHPVRVAKVFWAAIQSVVLMPFDPVVRQAVVFSVNWVMGGNRFRRTIVYEFALAPPAKQSSRLLNMTNIPFSTACPDLKLDVYCTSRPPSSSSSSPAASATPKVNGIHKSKGTSPVLVFIYGGAWSSGSKSYYRALGHTFALRGIVTVVPDYRTYPRGTMDDMISDVADALTWVHEHIHEYGGDRNNVHLMGHSAGAHLALLTVLVGSAGLTVDRDRVADVLRESGYYSAPVGKKKRARESKGEMPVLTQRLPKIRSCVLLSGVFNVVQHYDYESMRGVEEISGMRRAARTSLENMLLRSPTVLLSAAICSTSASSPTATWSAAIESALPKRMCIVHGTEDHTVPCTQAASIAELVRSFNPDVQLELRDGLNHVQPVADLMDAGSGLFADVVAFIHGSGPVGVESRDYVGAVVAH
ncbi:Alpha/Beta hydrolase protein [Catenaria anguillulae PL171]|uniref:Alpha/Beta hydrolase protein n=1 Tax=Catenaria anguillulae PL171 TaxID=765915 RepID=A0A1Y2HQG0_9FUNG|nr:Alpha/Beta hydrolase protein [Catenaria anguillulae PL171]